MFTDKLDGLRAQTASHNSSFCVIQIFKNTMLHHIILQECAYVHMHLCSFNGGIILLNECETIVQAVDPLSGHPLSER